MPTKFNFIGLDQFKADLRNLPAALTTDSDGVVQDNAENAGDAVRAAYRRHVLTGTLANGVRVKKKRAGKYGTAYLVESTSPLATIFEKGTEVRHYITVKGKTKLVGRMPAFNLFGPIMARHRRFMWLDLWRLLRKHGLLVSGDL
jgi:hypothetical protein